MYQSCVYKIDLSTDIVTMGQSTLKRKYQSHPRMYHPTTLPDILQPPSKKRKTPTIKPIINLVNDKPNQETVNKDELHIIGDDGILREDFLIHDSDD